MNTIFRSFAVAGLAAMATLAVGAQPTFTNTRVVDYSNHCCLGNLMAVVTAPNGSSLYMGDYYGDDIYFVATPLTTDGDNDDLSNTMTAADAPGQWVGGGWSYQDGALDGDTLYIGGANMDSAIPEEQTQLFAVTEDSPGVFTTNNVTGITGTYSGPDVVGPGKLILANYDTNGIQFFDVNSAVATADGAEIANTSPDITGYRTLSVDYDPTSGLIFAYMVADNVTRRIDVFTSDGTAAGTQWDRTLVAGAPSTLTVIGNQPSSNHNRSGQITIIDDYRILVCPFRDGVDEGFDVFDISTVDATETPYLTIKSTDFATDAWIGTGRDVVGSDMFTDGTNDYLALTVRNLLGVFQINDSAVNDWSMY